MNKMRKRLFSGLLGGRFAQTSAVCRRGPRLFARSRDRRRRRRRRWQSARLRSAGWSSTLFLSPAFAQPSARFLQCCAASAICRRVFHRTLKIHCGTVKKRQEGKKNKQTVGMCETHFFFLTVVRREGRSFEARGDVKHPVSRQASCFASSFFASTRGIGSDTLDSQTFTVGGQK